jgi:hypothetical protein
VLIDYTDANSNICNFNVYVCITQGTYYHQPDFKDQELVRYTKVSVDSLYISRCLLLLRCIITVYAAVV